MCKPMDMSEALSKVFIASLEIDTACCPNMGHSGTEAWPTWAGVGCDNPVVLEKRARQGAPGTPTMWKCITRAITRPLLSLWGGPAALK